MTELNEVLKLLSTCDLLVSVFQLINVEQFLNNITSFAVILSVSRRTMNVSVRSHKLDLDSLAVKSLIFEVKYVLLD